MNLNNKNLFQQKNFVDGKWISKSKKINVSNPSTNKIIGSVPELDAKDVESCIKAAEKAFHDWKEVTAKERGVILRRWYDLIIKNQGDIARIITSENGKPLDEAKGEVLYAASFIKWFSEEAERVYGSVIPAPRKNQRIIVTKQPVGVCAAITPWNFPAAMITRKVGAATAVGCSIIVKPAAETPFTALALAKLAEEAGIPAGVLNVITGSAKEIGKVLTTNSIIRKISFTGSTEVGKILIKQSADTVKKVTMELGGNAPFIVFDDADLDKATKGLIYSKFRASGQTCVSPNRILVQQSVHNKFMNKLSAEIKKLKVGDGFEKGVNLGPLINNTAVEKVGNLIKEAKSKGAKVVLGGNKHKKGGNFFEPTIITGAKMNMELSCEEIFGPVIAIYEFKTENDAIKLANDTKFGLASYFYSENAARVFRVSEALEYGMVGANEAAISNEVAPFGGIKESGIGREGSFMGIDEYLETKYTCLGT